MAGARRPVFAEILKTSWSITLKEVRKRRVLKKKKRKNQTTTYRVSKGRVGKDVIDL